MDRILNSFTTRETALLVWIVIALILCLLNKGLRGSFVRVVKALFANKIILSLLAFFTHTAFYILIFSILGLWDITLLKDTVFWTFGFGFVALINFNKVNSKTYFKKMFQDAVKGTILIEFIANFFTFSLLIELILLPTVVIATITQAVASFDKKYKPIENLIKKLFLYSSIFVLLFSFYKTVVSYSELFTIENCKSLMLPVVLTITFLPFMYLFSLFAMYETLWITLKFIIIDKAERKKVKHNILLVANFSIDKLVSIKQNIEKPVKVYNDTSLDMVKQISKGSYIGND